MCSGSAMWGATSAYPMIARTDWLQAVRRQARRLQKDRPKAAFLKTIRLENASLRLGLLVGGGWG